MLKFVLSGFADEIDKDLNVQMTELKKNGIHQVELRGVNGKGVVDYTLNEVRDIKKQLDEGEITVSAIGSPIGKIKITDPFGPHLDQFKHTLELAEILETQYIRMFSFFMPEGENPKNYRDEVLERWGKFVETVRGTDFILAHENEKDIYGDTAERCLELLKAMNSPHVKAVFDPANFIQCHVETYPKAYELLKPYISYMHIKDALLENGKVVPAGMGDGKVAEIIKDLNASRQGEMVLSLEPHLGSFDGFAALENSIDFTQMEESGPGKFQVAADALKNILNQWNLSY